MTKSRNTSSPPRSKSSPRRGMATAPPGACCSNGRTTTAACINSRCLVRCSPATARTRDDFSSTEVSMDGSARRAARWRVLFLSSGEIGLADKVMEDGTKRLAAGQHVRIVDVAADAGTGLGLFEHLHGFTSADALARHLRSASGSVYGVAAPIFLESIAGDLDGVRAAVAQHSL